MLESQATARVTVALTEARLRVLSLQKPQQPPSRAVSAPLEVFLEQRYELFTFAVTILCQLPCNSLLTSDCCCQIVGGLIPLSATGKLQCPRAIVVGRAFVARMQPVRDLRPQALPVKLATLGVGTSVLNVPFGMWREHTRKFSPEWFLAVHATIPFVAMTRQGIGMPKTVIFLTIGSAILGQAVGARLERQRLLLMDKQKQEQVAELAMDSVTGSSSDVQKQRFGSSQKLVAESHDSLFSIPGNHILSLASNLNLSHVAAVGA